MNNYKINDRVIEKYILGELPAAKEQEIERYLREDRELSKEIEGIKADNKDFLNRFPPDLAAEEIYTRLSSRIIRKREIAKKRLIYFKRMLLASPALILLIIILSDNLAIFRINNGKGNNNNNKDSMRIKGLTDFDISQPHLVVFRKNKDQIELLRNGDMATAGDIIQLSYVSIEESHGLILSIDGNGKVTLHFPDTNDESTVLEMGKRVSLSSAFLLDNAPEFERFFFVTSNSEIDVERIVKRAEDWADNPEMIKESNFKLDEKLKQYSIVIKKGILNEK